jgi:hypothetical protein
MSTELTRCWDLANHKFIYSDGASCDYDECWNAATKQHGVYCDATFYARCWDATAKNWKVTVGCCESTCDTFAPKEFIAVKLTWDGTVYFDGLAELFEHPSAGYNWYAGPGLDLWFSVISFNCSGETASIDFTANHGIGCQKNDTYANVVSGGSTSCNAWLGSKLYVCEWGELVV